MAKYIEMDLNDPRAGLIAEIMANETSKKIIGVLAEKEMSESDISKELGIPMNTVGYNVKKLVESGLIEKTKGFFWSSRGKKINSYKVVNKKVVISPKSSFRGVLAAAIFSVVAAVGIWTWVDYVKINSTESFAMPVADGGERLAAGSLQLVQNNIASSSYSWAWFLLGAFATLLVLVLWNWRKRGVENG